MSQRRRADSTCTAVRCSASSPSAPLNRVFRIIEPVQPECGGPRKAQRHCLAPRGMEEMFPRITLYFRPPGIGDDEAGLRRHDLGFEIGGDGEIEPVAEIGIFRPFNIARETPARE